VRIVLKVVYLEKNLGLGNALRVALENCQHELVARMDSDDVSAPCRFEIQLQYLNRHPQVDIVGGNITEFLGREDNVIGQRYVPETDSQIKAYMKKRCAFNHVSVMYKKSAVMKAGGYKDWFCNEDYYLWIRMMLSGAVFSNVSENLVNVRVGNEMSARRGGMKYFKSEAALQEYMLQKHVIGIPRYLYNVALRFAGEVIASNSLRAKLFRFTRKKHTYTNHDKKAEAKIDAAYPSFSVAMCVYEKDNPEWFDRAMESLMEQSVRPTEIVLVVDGPIPEILQAVIDKYIGVDGESIQLDSDDEKRAG